jgi:hypothetical protein
MNNVQQAANDPTRIALSWWQDTRVRALAQILFLIGMGAVATLMKKITFPLGIPGHSGVLWLGTLVAGRALVRRDGAGLLMGASMALWAIPIGLNKPFTYNLGLYATTGLTLDIVARLPRISIRHPLGAIFCGMMAHMVKFGFIAVPALVSGVTKKFVLVGPVESGLLHLAFGAAAGLLGWGTYWVRHRSRSNHHAAKKDGGEANRPEAP